MRAKTIAFINFKGGVGKTATVVNLGATIAKYHGKKVLIVDLDPQCNSSLWLLDPEVWREHVSDLTRSAYQIFDDHIVGTHHFDFEKAVLRGVPYSKDGGFSMLSHLDLLPGSVELLRLEDRLHQNRTAPYFKYLHQTLRPYQNDYDYIFLDCAPNLYSITKNALFAADYCVVPYVPDYLSLSGFGILADEVEKFYESVSGHLQGRKRPKIAALIVSHYRKIGDVFKHAVNELEQMAIALRASDQIHRKTVILEPYIRHDVKVAESTSEHLPVVLHAPSSIGSQDYADLAVNFLNHFENL
ncbi:Cellulose biosynthesis protein BcsQ [Verrucomicrobium sp. GAS474]|uniref:ParA family protein n=1 Tax=Verrucomicrobium sp. GAS474 TaxID=1882831 RepID=UPI000879D506|nr:ParA family protein [Verrucomicrobium sp. GAS474]SDT96770.1 Cellulose biosynthesis protein BcsQ [Verrucomicrobium sp. GAS474]